MLTFTLRKKAILAGLYLSKFNEKGLNELGFENFTEAFNVIGFSLGVQPASIKNYRDEFDPVFPNKRKGWHKREMRQYCKDIYTFYKDLDLNKFSTLLKQIIYKNSDLDILMEKISQKEDKESSFAKRLITGQAAEKYFKNRYTEIDIFKDYYIEDCTNTGCGFDFKLSLENKKFLGVEVKGLNSMNGVIALTNKEYTVAQYMRDRYFLFVVKNFRENPFHKIIQHPFNSQLNFKKIETKVTQITWNTKV